MTINQLHKITAKLIAAGAGRRGVCVSKDTFTHPLESDGATILDVSHADLRSFPMMDDDGGTAVDSRGREKNIVAFVLEGSAREVEQLPGADRDASRKPDSQPPPEHRCRHNILAGHCPDCPSMAEIEPNEREQAERLKRRGTTGGTY